MLIPWEEKKNLCMSALAQTNILKEMFSDDSRRDDPELSCLWEGRRENRDGVKQGELSWEGEGKGASS